MSVTAIASQRWPALTLHLDAEGDYTRDGAFAYIGGFTLEGPDAWAVRPVSEFFVAHQTEAPVTVSGLVGAIWRARPHLSFDSAIPLAHQGSAQEIEVRVGLTWSFAM